MADTRPDFTALFEAVKACDLADVMQRLGHQVRADRKAVPNPLRGDDDTPSFSVGTKGSHRWHDFATDEGGDLIDFLQATGLDVDTARQEAAQILGVASSSSSSVPRKGPGGASLKSDTAKLGKAKKPQAADYTRLVDAAHEALLLGTSATAHRARAYLKHRGFDLDNGAADLIRLARVGVIDETVDLPDSLNARTYRDRIVFPYLEANGAARFFNARAAGEVEEGEKFRKPTGANQALLIATYLATYVRTNQKGHAGKRKAIGVGTLLEKSGITTRDGLLAMTSTQARLFRKYLLDEDGEGALAIIHALGAFDINLRRRRDWSDFYDRRRGWRELFWEAQIDVLIPDLGFARKQLKAGTRRSRA